MSHQERDEGSDCYRRIVDYAKMPGVDLIAGGFLLGTSRRLTAEGKKICDLWDCYANPDLVTYPSTFEGFGNAFLEAVFCRKPLMVDRHPIFERDIEPIGFQAALIDDYITEDTIHHVRRLLDEPELRNATVSSNFELRKKYFSYDLLEERLKYEIMNFGTVS